MIRREIRLSFLRWRELFVGLAIMLIGLYWAAHSSYFWTVFGAIVVIGGFAFAITGLSRGRFRRSGTGAGVVRLVEGQLGYFGPHDGGVVDVDEIVSLARNGNYWQIASTNGTVLTIPRDASGADILFDVFGRLPGLDMRRVLAGHDDAQFGPVLLWQRNRLND